VLLACSVMAAVSPLGSVSSVDLDGVQLRYYERGEGPPVVFVHGLFANAHLWRKVVPGIAAAGYRCLAPDWPLGSHAVPVPDADLTPPGVANLIASFLRKLHLEDVTVVANDTGGALTQILMNRHPELAARVVLTPSDCYDRFLPSFLKALTQAARIPGSMRLVTEALRIRALHPLPIAFGWLVKRPLTSEVLDVYLQPSRRDPAVRRDLRRFVRAVDKSYTLQAAASFPRFTKPVLLAWASEDRFFPLRLANRLSEDLPNATLKTIEDCYTWVPEEQPERLLEMILGFMRASASSQPPDDRR
jgi:pimeloyl-ACP methyl ester carboxylesterase